MCALYYIQVLDQLFVGGEEVLLAAAVAVLQMLEPVLMACDDTGEAALVRRHTRTLSYTSGAYYGLFPYNP